MLVNVYRYVYSNDTEITIIADEITNADGISSFGILANVLVVQDTSKNCLRSVDLSNMS